MKKLLIILALGIFSFGAYSQAKLEVGIKGGLNLSNVSSDIDASYNSRTGFHAGAYGLIKIASIGIQPELLYSQQGTEADFGGAVGELEQDFTYFSIPVLLKFYLPAGLNLQAGPQFGMLLSADGRTLDDGGNEVEVSKESIKNSDISAALGAGWDAPFGLRLSARYVIGLNDINDFSSGDKTKNRMFQLSAGFSLFKIGK